MIYDLDIACAKLLIDQHDEKAARYAALCADALLETGDREGHREWLRVIEAIEGLLSKDRPADAKLH